MNYEVGRTPDYDLSALNKGNEHKGKVGCAWKNEDETISIKLNPFVTLSAVQDLVITLFPHESFRKRKKSSTEVNEVSE